MKKAVILLTALILVFSSCQRKHPVATDIIFEVLGSLENVPAYGMYYSGASRYSENILDAERAELLYRDSEMLSYAESFAVVLGKDDSVWEIHVFVALSASDAQFIENALRCRLERIQNDEIYIYDAEAYEKRIESAKVASDGRLVCLVICDDNTLALQKILKK